MKNWKIAKRNDDLSSRKEIAFKSAKIPQSFSDVMKYVYKGNKFINEIAVFTKILEPKPNDLTKRAFVM